VGTLAAIWQLILLALKYGPAVEAVVEEGEDWVMLRVKLAKVDKAIDKAKNEDDTRPLNDLLPK
jgi:hypothetical protein